MDPKNEAGNIDPTKNATPPADNAAPAAAAANEAKPAGNESKTFTEAEVEAMIQREADRRVNQAVTPLLKTREEAEALKKQLAEKMTEDERKRWELEEREKRLVEAEANAAAERRTRIAVEEVAARKWPAEAAKILEADSPEVVKERAAAIEVIAGAIAAKLVQDRLAATGGRPASVGAPGTNPGVKITREQLETMSPEDVVAAMQRGDLSHLLSPAG